MARFKVSLEYEGTRYRGWQLQKNARTVQGEIHHALGSVFKTDDFEFVGSGRTDAGVHALLQVAHLDVQTMLAPEIIRMKLNDALPSDVNILEVEKVHPRFHARHDAVARRYLYQISRRRTALGKRFVWWIKDDVNIDRMRGAISLFSGMKNLRSFTDDSGEEKSTKVLIDEVAIHESGSLILVTVRGSHFLWKLVRRIVGVIVEVGRGTMTVDTVHRFLVTETDEPARYTAPPSGLFLEKVYYPGDALQSTPRPFLLVEPGPGNRRRS
ncbi:MAG: tRNA pseudouridine(38-40) synthase TruA [Ignavibacteria bacterium]|nr:tRNA pseudouridine(38-40) synthase TruA [Ignavibacteria bacterium]